jgi:hypothetical protein
MAKTKIKGALVGGTKQVIAVDPSLQSFDGHLFFEKKAADAKAFLKKVGLPKQLTKKAQPK